MTGRPWFPVYAADALTDLDLNELTDGEFRLLFRAWCVCCKEGYIPKEEGRLRKALNVPRGSRVNVAKVTRFFRESDADGCKLISHRMEADAAKYRETCEKRREAANKRHHKGDANAVQSQLQPQLQPQETTTDAVAAAPARPSGKVALVVDTWNRLTAGKLPHAKLTPKRDRIIGARLKEDGWFEDFDKACAFVAASDFHNGQNDRGWVATLDYLLQAGKATEIAEKATQPTTALATTGGTRGTNKPSATHERVNSNLAAIAAAAARRNGLPGIARAGGPDGEEIPEPRPVGRDGGISPRLREARPPLFPDERS